MDKMYMLKYYVLWKLIKTDNTQIGTNPTLEAPVSGVFYI